MTRFIVKGEKELARSFKQVQRDVLRELRPTLRAAAEPVRLEAQNLFMNYDAKSALGYKTRVRAKGVAVEQSLRRTTGDHPQFGSLQMREALVPALNEKGEDVRRAVETMVDIAGIRAGF